jgi:hypothetical protein
MNQMDQTNQINLQPEPLSDYRKQQKLDGSVTSSGYLDDSACGEREKRDE